MNFYKAYTGRIGCMCGCRGKYSYTERGAVEHSPGYDVSDKVNERSVKIIVGKLLRDPNTKHEAGLMYSEQNGRTLVAFFD